MVIQPQVTIHGGPDIHVKARSVVHLKCIISQTVDPPAYVTWFFNNKMLVDFTGADVSLSHSLAVSTSRKTNINRRKYLNNLNIKKKYAGVHGGERTIECPSLVFAHPLMSLTFVQCTMKVTKKRFNFKKARKNNLIV